MDDAKLRNRNVCEEHFATRMFMNSRKERLVRFAYPTLLKTHRNGKMYDLEAMQETCELDELSVDSVLDESFDQFLVDDDENPTIEVAAEVEVEKDSSFMLDDQNVVEIPVEYDEDKKPHIKKQIKPVSNKIVLTPVAKRILKRPILPKTEQMMTPVPQKKVKTFTILNSANLIKTGPPVPPLIRTAIPVTIIKAPGTPETFPRRNEDVETIKKLTEERDQAIQNEKAVKQHATECEAKIKQLEAKVQELSKKLLFAEAAKPDDVKVIAFNRYSQTNPELTNSVQASPTPSPSSAKAGALGKPQLFVGIKRYLSNAMATLLKMEMFGNSEREWKADEKKISCELMKLGTDVYEYFTDEWRLRLPSKSEVTDWMQTDGDAEDEEIF